MRARQRPDQQVGIEIENVRHISGGIGSSFTIDENEPAVKSDGNTLAVRAEAQPAEEEIPKTVYWARNER